MLPSIEEFGVLAKMQICRGQLRMIFVAQTIGAVTVDDVPHTTWAKKFEQRFRAFHNVMNPPMLTLETYDNLVKSGLPLKSKSSPDNSSSDEQRGHRQSNVVSMLQAASACYLKGRQYIDVFRGVGGNNKGGVQLPCLGAGDAIFKASSSILYKVRIYIYSNFI